MVGKFAATLLGSVARATGRSRAGMAVIALFVAGALLLRVRVAPRTVA